MQFLWSTADDAIRVRNAQAKDAPAVEALYRELTPGNDGICVLPERLDQVAEDPNSLLLVATIDGTVRGTASITFCLDAMFRHQPFGLLENIIVGAGTRTRGIGRALMAAIDAAAIDRDCSKLMLLSSAARPDAHRFFERCGYNSSAKKGFVRYRRLFMPDIAAAKKYP
jgi:N-acetylglutamate synthase-like GNAT family acetyltransferase